MKDCRHVGQKLVAYLARAPDDPIASVMWCRDCGALGYSDDADRVMPHTRWELPQKRGQAPRRVLRSKR